MNRLDALRLAAPLASLAALGALAACSPVRVTPAVPAASATPTQTAEPVPSSSPTSLQEPESEGLPVREVSSQLRSSKCDVSAESTLLGSNKAALREAAQDNPASRALPTGEKASTPEQALQEAEHRRSQDAGRTGDVETAKPDAAVTMVTFADSMLLLGSSVEADDFVAPNRCVYVVTVHAEVSVGHGPPGVDLSKMVYDSYTMVIDVASGEQLAFTTGPDIPDIITGEGLVALQ